MAFLQFSRISLAFGDRDILKDVTLNLAEGTKAALAGANGSGKSTLMKVMAGLIAADSGDRAIEKGTRVSYLPQSGIVHSGCTLREETERAFERGHRLSAQLEQLGEELASCAGDETRTKKLLDEYHTAQTELENSGWDRRQMLAEQVLTGLGFVRDDFDRPVGEFSGGWQMRVALAKVLLEKPDILLLDEPTNYLDLEARTWLEQWLREFPGGFLLVSHDRFFLDETITEVYELFSGVLHRYPGNYTHYEQVRHAELESLIARYELQQEQIRKLEDFVRRFRYKPTKAAQAQERLKQLEKMERIEIPESMKKIRFRFPPAPHAGRIVLSLEHVSRSYPSKNGPDRVVLDGLNLVVETGDHLVVTGRNGAGKSPLLRILSGADADCAGAVRTGAGVAAGYFSQDNAETMKGSMSVIEMLEAEAPTDLVPKLRDLLGAFLFRGDDIYKTVDMLSGGEKSRLALLRLLLRPVNLLILDEPTNHLDIHSKDVLLAALKDFGGTVIFVSHDRSFIESLADRVLELTPGHARLFPGGYGYYLEQTETVHPGEKQPDVLSAAEKNVGASAGQLRREDEKKRKAERRRLEREEEQLLAEIETCEQTRTALLDRLSDADVYSDGEKCRAVQKEISEVEERLAFLSGEWEKTASGLSAFM